MIVRQIGTLLLAVSAGGLGAQSWEVFDMAGSGFPSNRIMALAEDPDGSLWVATDWGLLHGVDDQWTIYQESNSDLPDNAVRCLAFDEAGRLWVGTTNNGIGILDQGVWSFLHPGNSPLVSEEVSHIAHDQLGRTWIATPLGLHTITDGQWVLYDDSSESHNGHVLLGPNMGGTALGTDGLAAVYTRNAGLLYFDDAEFVGHTIYNSELPDNSANGIAFDPAGDRWIATANAGLLWHFGPYAEYAWIRFDSFTAGLPDNTLTSILVGPDGRKYAGTEIAGLLLFDGPDDWSALDQANSGLPDDHVRCLLMGSDGTLWAGTNGGGLARYSISLQVPVQAKVQPSIFPNPCTGPVHIVQDPATGPGHWQLLSSVGRLIGSGPAPGGPAWTLPLPGLPGGLYFLRLASGGTTHTLRLIHE